MSEPFGIAKLAYDDGSLREEAEITSDSGSVCIAAIELNDGRSAWLFADSDGSLSCETNKGMVFEWPPGVDRPTMNNADYAGVEGGDGG